MEIRNPKLLLLLCLAVVMVSAAGCSPPVVNVSYTIPAAMPLPPDSLPSVGEFSLADIPAADAVSGQGVTITPELAKFVMGRLGGALVERGVAKPGESASQDPKGCVVSGVIRLAVADTRGSRDIVRLDPGTHLSTADKLPTLVRRATLRAEFAFTCPKLPEGQRRIGIAEVVRTYNSAADPNVRGELGLGRPDDPARVPPVETILGNLLDQCADAFKRMIAPARIEASMELRRVRGEAADEAFAAVSKKDWLRAASVLDDALQAQPDNAALHFNLAATTEGCCRMGLPEGYAAADVPGVTEGVSVEDALYVFRLAVAEQHYRRAYELSGEKDQEALDGEHRCRRVRTAKVSASLVELDK